MLRTVAFGRQRSRAYVKGEELKIRRLLILLCAAMLLTTAVSAKQQVYLPDFAAREIYAATSFLDENEIQHLSEAQTLAALGILTGDGRYFSPKSTYSVAYALRLAYRSAGREQEGLDASFNSEMRAEYGLGDYSENAWADGFYMLAVKDMLLTRDDIADVFKKGTGKYLKDNAATSAMLTKWLCLLNNISFNSAIFKYEPDIPPYMKPYCGGLYLEGIYSKQDVTDFCRERPVTRDDTAYIFSRFYNYILPALGIAVCTGTVTKICENYSVANPQRDVYVNCGDEQLILRTHFSPDAPVFSTLDDEFALLGKNGSDTSGALRCGDEIEMYIRSERVVFVRMKKSVQHNEVLAARMIFKGKIYLYDSVGGEIVLKDIRGVDTNYSPAGLVGMFTDTKIKIYYKNEQVDINRLNYDLADKSCIAYLKTDYNGGLEKIFSVIVFD